MDKEITKGITIALTEKNENSVKRRLIARGMEMILSQKNDKQSVVKKQLIKLFVKKNNGVE